MKTFLSVACALLLSACAGLSGLQRAQQSHDALALAQDTEARLCWDVPNVAAAIAAHVTPNHCTTPAALRLPWTDARHQDFNRWLKQALDAQAAFTRVLASGGTADATTLNGAVGTLLAILGNLPQTSPVIQQLTVQVSKARIAK